jgi:hypothetical protein
MVKPLLSSHPWGRGGGTGTTATHVSHTHHYIHLLSHTYIYTLIYTCICTQIHTYIYIRIGTDGYKAGVTNGIKRLPLTVYGQVALEDVIFLPPSPSYRKLHGAVTDGGGREAREEGSVRAREHRTARQSESERKCV